MWEKEQKPKYKMLIQTWEGACSSFCHVAYVSLKWEAGCHTLFFELRMLQKEAVTWHSLVAFHRWSCRYVTCLVFHQGVTQLCTFPLSLFLERSLWQQAKLISRSSPGIIYVICDIRVSKFMLQSFTLWDRTFYLEQGNAFYLFVPGVSVPSVLIIHVKRYVLCKIWFLFWGKRHNFKQQNNQEAYLSLTQVFSCWICVDIGARILILYCYYLVKPYYMHLLSL